MRGRGIIENPTNRFERLEVAIDESVEQENDTEEPQKRQLRTSFLKDHSQSIITTTDSPDMGLVKTLNPYRGCEHGCVYCYARPTHEYLGFSAGLDFESKIMVKEDAPELLWNTLASSKWEPFPLSMSGVTDPYQPVEKHLKLTRRCLEVLGAFRNPVAIITKNHLVTRDMDVLGDLAKHNATMVAVSVTSLDAELARIMEPRTSSPQMRLNALETLSKAGIPTCVGIAPVIPGINDHEIPKILQTVAKLGVRRAFYVMLRLPHGVKDLFSRWLEEHFPKRKEKVLSLLRDMHGGKIYRAEFGKRFVGEGPYAEQIKQLFTVQCRKLKLNQGEAAHLSTEAFRRLERNQIELFPEA